MIASSERVLSKLLFSLCFFYVQSNIYLLKYLFKCFLENHIPKIKVELRPQSISRESIES